MFADAYKLASGFTQPVITSMRLFDETVKCEYGAFIVVNREGWIITVAHLFDSYVQHRQHTKEISVYHEKVQAIQADQSLKAKQKRKRIGRLASNSEWITNHIMGWGGPAIVLKEVKAIREVDLAIGRLEPFDPTGIAEYPVFKDPTRNLNPGTSLCRLGYPFHKIEATFDEATNSFKLANGALPLPRFPIEGIYTRNKVGKSKDGKHDIKFLETSSPGLRGQSGGPIFDRKGTVWAVQSQTVQLDMGFTAKVKKKKRKVEEHQFLNVGLGVHPELVVGFLKDNGIEVSLSDY